MILVSVPLGLFAQVHSDPVQDEVAQAVRDEEEEGQLRHDRPHLPRRLPHSLPRLQHPLLDWRILDENFLTGIFHKLLHQRFLLSNMHMLFHYS